MSSSIFLRAPSASRSKAPDLLAFLGALFRGRSFAPALGDLEHSPHSQEPSPEGWLAYYGICVQYISSLHNQFIATLSIQGALAVGCLAAIEAVTPNPKSVQLGQILGFLGVLMELALTWIAAKLFRQHCVTCWMLAKIEQERLGLPSWAAMKSLLGTEGNRLFTSPSTLVLTVAYGLVLASVLGFGGFKGL